MDRYKIIKKGIFQRISSFEEQINALSAEGWKVVTASSESNRCIVILERTR